MSFFSLAGKTVLVTGSTSGIGLGVARSLAKRGCANLLLHGLGERSFLEQQHKAFQAEFPDVKVLLSTADVSDWRQVRRLIEEEVPEGRVDVLVNNAGVQHVAKVEDFHRDQWDRILSTNLSAVFHATSAALPGMRERGWGRVINTASVHGLVASAGKSAYVAAKHGVVGFTKAVALEVAGSGITVNCVNPGWVRTPLVEQQIEAKATKEGVSLDEAARRLLSEKQPSGQFATCDQIGECVAFLCSPAADQINGISLPVDGGWTAQ